MAGIEPKCISGPSGRCFRRCGEDKTGFFQCRYLAVVDPHEFALTGNRRSFFVSHFEQFEMRCVRFDKNAVGRNFGIEDGCALKIDADASR